MKEISDHQAKGHLKESFFLRGRVEKYFLYDTNEVHMNAIILDKILKLTSLIFDLFYNLILGIKFALLII